MSPATSGGISVAAMVINVSLGVKPTDILNFVAAEDVVVKQQEGGAKVPEAAQEAAQDDDELDIQLDEDVRLQLFTAHSTVLCSSSPCLSLTPPSLLPCWSPRHIM